MEIEKAYFPLADVLDRWGIAESDLIYLAENDLLRLSIRVFDLPLEFGDFETEDGGVFRIPFSRKRYSGVLDLCAADAFEVFRCAEHFVARFRSEGADYVTVLDGAEPVLVMIGDLLLRREERDRAERQHGLGAAAAGVFVASADYQEIRHNGRHYRLGPIQAAVVRALHAACLAGDPWCEGKVILAEAGSRSLRMADVFKSQEGWRSLIRSNRRGSYRLDL